MYTYDDLIRHCVGGAECSLTELRPPRGRYIPCVALHSGGTLDIKYGEYLLLRYHKDGVVEFKLHHCFGGVERPCNTWLYIVQRLLEHESIQIQWVDEYCERWVIRLASAHNEVSMIHVYQGLKIIFGKEEKSCNPATKKQKRPKKVTITVVKTPTKKESRGLIATGASWEPSDRLLRMAMRER